MSITTADMLIGYQAAPMAWTWANLSREVRANLLMVAVVSFECSPGFAVTGMAGPTLRGRLERLAALEWLEVPESLRPGVLLAVNQ